MPSRAPQDIWQEGIEEGHRRLTRDFKGLAASGLAGGAEVGLGILAVVVVAGAAHEIAPEHVSHVVSAMVFGIAFVLITLGRAELFTENFHIPVAAVHAGRAPLRMLWRMWIVTLIFNLLGLLLVLAPLSLHDVLTSTSIEAAGPPADTYGTRALLPAFVSAIVAGLVMTLFTWVVHSAESGSAKVLICMLVGFLLVAPSLNHAVVAFGKVMFGLLTDTTAASFLDLWRNLAIAIVGNLIGGVGIVFTTRLAQVKGEPGT